MEIFMKKALVAALLLAAFALPVHSLGIGAAFTPNFGFTSNTATNAAGAALTFQLDKSPYVFGIGARANNGFIAIGMTADMWLAKGKLIDFLNYYAGPGLFAGIAGGNGYMDLDLGLRIPVGINAFLLKNTLELFLEIAPAFGVGLGNEFRFPTLGLQGAFGFRFWF